MVIISVNNFNWLVFLMDMQGVLYDVGTTTTAAAVLYGLMDEKSPISSFFPPLFFFYFLPRGGGDIMCRARCTLLPWQLMGPNRSP
jgi:hypothetical protein